MDPNAYNQQNPGTQAPPGAPFVPASVQPDPSVGMGQPYQGQPAPSVTQPTGYQPHTFSERGVPSGEMQSNFDMQQTAFAPQASPPMSSGAVVAPGAPGAAIKPAVHANPNSTQNTLLIAEIRDGIVIMNDGSFRSVVMVKSVNFDLMSPQEQEAVEYSYQGFLNSLYFPIQIFIRSQKVDLQPYIEKLDKIRSEHDNMLLAMMMEDYIDYIDRLSQQTNIMDKKFYVVIPYFPHVDVQKAITQSKNFITGLVDLFNTKEQHVVVDEAELEKAKTELRNRVQAVLSGLLQSGVQGLPLDTQELIELYYDTYNPDTATRQQLKNFDMLSADIVTKGKGAAPQAHLQRELT